MTRLQKLQKKRYILIIFYSAFFRVFLTFNIDFLFESKKSYTSSVTAHISSYNTTIYIGYRTNVLL